MSSSSSSSAGLCRLYSKTEHLEQLMGEEVTDINEILAVINNIQVVVETRKINNNNKQVTDETANNKLNKNNKSQRNDFTGESNTAQPKSSWTGTAGENDGSAKK